MNDLEWIRESNLIEDVDNPADDKRGVQVWNQLACMPWVVDTILWIHRRLLYGHHHANPGRIRVYHVWVGGHKGMSPFLIADALRNFIYTYATAADAEIITHSHVIFERIHPFEDGNGRTGRMLMNWQRVRAGLNPLLIKASERQTYYQWFR